MKRYSLSRPLAACNVTPSHLALKQGTLSTMVAAEEPIFGCYRRREFPPVIQDPHFRPDDPLLPATASIEFTY